MEMGADRSWSFENIINKLGYSSRKIAAVEWHLRTADFVVANSELQMRFLVNELPEIAGRVSYVHLGIEPFEQDSCIRQSRCSVVAVSGGTRPVKGSDVVARAVSSLRGRNVDCELRVYGRQYAANDDLSAIMDGEMCIRDRKRPFPNGKGRPSITAPKISCCKRPVSLERM